MNDILEKEVLVEVEQDSTIAIHDSLELDKELQQWIQSVIKVMLSEI
jgi:hypothetical protein